MRLRNFTIDMDDQDEVISNIASMVDDLNAFLRKKHEYDAEIPQYEFKPLFESATSKQAEGLIYGLTEKEINLIKARETIGAIKCVRERTGYGLKEAKDLVDAAKRSMGSI